MVTKKVLRNSSFKSMRSKISRSHSADTDGGAASIATSGSKKSSGKEKSKSKWMVSRTRSGASKRGGGGVESSANGNDEEQRGPDEKDKVELSSSSDPNNSKLSEEKRDVAEGEATAAALATADNDPTSTTDLNGPDGIEVDYDSTRGPTRLYKLIESRMWKEASVRADKFPSEASVWVRRYDCGNGGSGSASSVASGSHRSLATLSNLSDLSERTRWRLLPLHAAVSFGAPSYVVRSLLKAQPAAARARDDKGSLPLHLACRDEKLGRGGGGRGGDCDIADVVSALLNSYPEGAFEEDGKGRTPMVLADAARRRAENNGAGVNGWFGGGVGGGGKGEANEKNENDALSALETFLRGEEGKEEEEEEGKGKRGGDEQQNQEEDRGAGGVVQVVSCSSGESSGWLFGGGGFSLFDAFKSDRLWAVDEEQEQDNQEGQEEEIETLTAISSKGTLDSGLLADALSEASSDDGTAGGKGSELDTVGSGSLRSVESHFSTDDEDDGEDCIVSLGGGGEYGGSVSFSSNSASTDGSRGAGDRDFLGTVGSSFFCASSDGGDESSIGGGSRASADGSYASTLEDAVHCLTLDERHVAVDVMSTITDAHASFYEDDDDLTDGGGTVEMANANWDETSVMAEILMGSPLVPILDENLLEPDEGVQNVIDDINAPRRAAAAGGGGSRKKSRRGSATTKEGRRRRDKALSFLGKAVRLGTASDRVRLVASRGLMSSLCNVLAEGGAAANDDDARTSSTVEQRRQTIGVLMQLADLPLLRFRELRPALEEGAAHSSDEGLRKAGSLLLMFLSKHEKRGYDLAYAAAGAAGVAAVDLKRRGVAAAGGAEEEERDADSAVGGSSSSGGSECSDDDDDGSSVE